ncbi:hypothetical protein QYF36_018037 [Acer negundo]|nr:hypothetical protein QYF36_018037 [Acer negundo]
MMAKKILEAPILPAVQRSALQSPESQEFHFETMARANQHAKTSSVASTEVFHQILEAPILSAMQRNAFQPPEFQEFHFETMVRDNQHAETSLVASTEVSSKQSKEATPTKTKEDKSGGINAVSADKIAHEDNLGEIACAQVNGSVKLESTDDKEKSKSSVQVGSEVCTTKPMMIFQK